MTAHVRVGGTFKDVNEVYTRVGGVWKSVEEGYTRVAGVWKQWFASYNPAMELIATVNVTAAQTPINITNIPQTFRHLRVVVLGRSTTTSNGFDILNWRINNNTQNIFSGIVNQSNFGSLGLAVGVTPLAFPRSPSGFDNRFGLAIFDFINYTSSDFKVFQIAGGAGFATSQAPTFLVNGIWRNTAAITQLNFLSQNQNFAVGSRFSVYGVKA